MCISADIKWGKQKRTEVGEKGPNGIFMYVHDTELSYFVAFLIQNLFIHARRCLRREAF